MEPSAETYHPPLNSTSVPPTLAAPVSRSLNESGKDGHVVATLLGPPVTVLVVRSTVMYWPPRKTYSVLPTAVAASIASPCGFHWLAMESYRCGAPEASIAHSVPSQPDEMSVGGPKAVVEAMGLNVGCGTASPGSSTVAACASCEGAAATDARV